MKKFLLLSLILFLLISCQSSFKTESAIINELEYNVEGEYPNCVVMLAVYKDLNLGEGVASHIKSLAEELGCHVITFCIDTTSSNEEMTAAIESALTALPPDTEHLLLANYYYVLDHSKAHFSAFDCTVIDIVDGKKLLHYRFSGKNDIDLNTFFLGVADAIDNQRSLTDQL